MTTRISRFVNYLRSLLPSSDVSVMELVAKTMGRLALVSGSKASEYVTFEVKRAFEWLSGDRVEVKTIAFFCLFFFSAHVSIANFTTH